MCNHLPPSEPRGAGARAAAARRGRGCHGPRARGAEPAPRAPRGGGPRFGQTLSENTK